MSIIIQQEQRSDYQQVFELVAKAFADMEKSDQQEHHIIERLRKSDAFIPELSLVARQESRVVGHILISKIKIKNTSTVFDSLSLAPIAVLPEFQRQGIGAMLIRTAHQVARNLGYDSVVLVGHENYYPRFGYVPASKFGIQFPFDSPDENCMAVELTSNALQDVNGMVVYPKEFFG